MNLFPFVFFFTFFYFFFFLMIPELMDLFLPQILPPNDSYLMPSIESSSFQASPTRFEVSTLKIEESVRSDSCIQIFTGNKFQCIFFLFFFFSFLFFSFLFFFVEELLQNLEYKNS